MDLNPWRKTLRFTALAQVQHVRPVSPAVARDLVARVYAELERDFGVLAPPVALHSPAPEVMAAAWMAFRECVLAEGRAARTIKEALAAAVSAANTCPYCATVHGAALNSLTGGEHAAAVAGGHFDRVQDPAIRATAEWARTAAVRDTVAEQPPFSIEQAPELLGVALVFHYINRMVNVFLPEAPMPPRAPGAALGIVTRLIGARIRAAAARSHPAGASLALLPDAPLPEDLEWAVGSPTVAGALARAAAAVDKAGESAVPRSVQAMVHAQLQGWDGRPPDLDRTWLHEAVRQLPPEDRPAGRLALLVALASWQIDASVLADYRATAATDRALIELTSWAAQTAARTIVSWSPAAWAQTVYEP
ncbi:carboxymuconolactone decarboxylase family protein [Actinocrinis sp.]|uniref:carboxymuconolactone decarboxylase family protein n=1 Tax=Actinocrinis sp. TaxID=1920516 RepID=UPI002D5E3C2D|nr:carboxymuconolactone decarboxylase family protein [Actinocrinis sp.]HZP54465.1 carboxymuconolactone decarboxylase family protein [Actinocrinis sp.]